MEPAIFGWFLVVSTSIPMVLPNSFGTPSETELKCHPYLTMNVTGNIVNGLLRAHGYEFPDGYYYRLNQTHFSVCICKVTKCLRKCCMPGQVFLNSTCVDWYSSPINPPVYDRSLRLIPNYDYSKFFIVYGNTCQYGWYKMDPKFGKEDIHYFLQSGDLFVPYNEIRSTFYTEEFCFENVIRSPDQPLSASSLETFGCFLHQETNTDIVRIGIMISIPFLLATFLVYAMPELRNLHGKNLMGHIGSLFIAYTSLVVVQMASNYLSVEVCIGFGYAIQFSFLACFFWLNVMCFDIWWAFSGYSSFKGDRKSTEMKKYLLYSIYAWGCPSILSIVTLILQFAPGVPNYILKPDIGVSSCFFTDQTTFLAYFYGPLALILLFDVIFFIMTAVKIIMVKKETVAVFRGKDSSRNRDASKQRYILYIKLFLIMGVNWIMEVISWAAKGPDWAWYFTDCTNALQGVLVFIMFVCKRRIWRLLIGKVCPHLKKKDSETSTSFTRMSASRNSSVVSAYNSNVLPMQTVTNRKVSSS